MSFIENIKKQAKTNKKTIVLPESEDNRILEATAIILKEDIANIILIGNSTEILEKAKQQNLDISKAIIEDSKNSEKHEEYTNLLYELRKHKGMTIEEASKLSKDPIYYATLMMKNNEADGLVSGAIHSTADTLRPALQILKTAPEVKLVSAFFILSVPNCQYGENGMFAFSDAGLNINPSAEELSEIAIETAKNFELLTKKQAKVAMLSYSTYNSAKGESKEKVIEATKLVKQKAPNILVDGELQLDAAIVPEVAKIKAKESPLQGNANVLIFPNLDSGNIGYKLVHRLAKAEAYGPVCQGIAKPVNDLSRGCSSEDVVGVVAITAIQAQNINK